MIFEQIMIILVAIISLVMLLIAFIVLIDRTCKEMTEINKNLKSIVAAYRGKSDPMKQKTKEIDTPRKETICPVCGASVYFYHKYCEKCGQPLDWKEDKQ